MASITDPLSHVTSFGYDDAGRQTTVTYPDPDCAGGVAAAVDTNAYDYLNRLTSVTSDPDGSGSAPSSVVSYGYDLLSQLTTITDPLGEVTTNEYDIAGQLLSLKDPLNNETRWAYDGLGRGTLESNPLGGARTYEYNPSGTMSRRIDRMGRIMEFSYDYLDRKTAENWYNAASTASDPTGSYTYTSDELARVISEKSDFTGQSLTPKIWLYRSYDAASNQTELSAKFDQIVDEMPTMTKDFKNTYTFDKLSRVTKIQQTNQSSGGGAYYAVASKQVDLSYNGLGPFTQIDRFENLTGTKPTLRSLYSYDNANRLTELNYRNIDASNNSTVLNDYDFVYDQMSRITSITSTADGATTITYDKRSQVTGADHANPRSDESYAYDDNGNRTGGSYSNGSNNQTTSDGTYNYTYDKEGNRTRRTKISDGSYEDFIWDNRNRLTKVSFKNSGGTELKSVEYFYDVYNRLIRRKYDADGPGSGAATNIFLVGYDGIHPTLAFDGTAQTDVSNRFLWGPQVDQLFADEQVTTPTSEGNVLWLLGDQVGTLRDIADYNGTAYTVTNHRTFDSFGNLTAESQSTVDEIFAYTGKFLDEVTKLSNHLNRWFDPGLGKWVSEDPIGFAAGDASLVRYVGNTNSIYVDSIGLESVATGPNHTATGGIENGNQLLSGTLPGVGSLLSMGGGNSFLRGNSSDEWDPNTVLGLLAKTPTGRKILSEIQNSELYIYQVEHVKVFKQERPTEGSDYGPEEEVLLGGLNSGAIVYIPRDISDEDAAGRIVHEVTHAVETGKVDPSDRETNPYVLQVQFLVELMLSDGKRDENDKPVEDVLETRDWWCIDQGGEVLAPNKEGIENRNNDPEDSLKLAFEGKDALTKIIPANLSFPRLPKIETGQIRDVTSKFKK